MIKGVKTMIPTDKLSAFEFSFSPSAMISRKSFSISIMISPAFRRSIFGGIDDSSSDELSGCLSPVHPGGSELPRDFVARDSPPPDSSGPARYRNLPPVIHTEAESCISAS